METKWTEPAIITQGETVKFTKITPDYPAKDGWSLTYSIRGNGQSISFSSVADGSNHSITVTAATTAAWLPAEYRLQGFAVSQDGSEKHEIYDEGLTIRENLSTAQSDDSQLTHAQRMLNSIEEQLEQCAKNILLETDVEGTKILRERRAELLKLRQAYKHERQGEIEAANARAGRPTSRKIHSRFNVMPGGNAFAFGSGNSVFNTQFP